MNCLAGSEVGEDHELEPRVYHFTPDASLHLWVMVVGNVGDVAGQLIVDGVDAHVVDVRDLCRCSWAIFGRPARPHR